MKLISKPSLRLEEFTGQADWIGKLFSQLNPFFQSVNQILNGNITFQDNIQSVDANYDIKKFAAFSILWPHNGSNPANLQVMKAYNMESDSPTILVASWNYDASKRSINVKNMLEVKATGNQELNTRFKFSIRVTI